MNAPRLMATPQDRRLARDYRAEAVAILARFAGPAAPSAGLPAPPGFAVLLQAMDRLPLELVVLAWTGLPLTHCPRSICTKRLAVSEANYWACTHCFTSGGTAAFVAAYLWDWGDDRVHRALCNDEGCCP